MNEQEKYRKTEEIINKFKNGKERYYTSSLFNVVVQMLVADVDYYEIINQLITTVENTNEAMKQYMLRTPPTPFYKNNIDT